MTARARAGALAALRELVPDAVRSPRGSTPSTYLAGEGVATAMFLALRLPQPLLLEGEAGVGKTEAARALAAALGTPLVSRSASRGWTPRRRCTSGTTAPAAADPARGGRRRRRGGGGPVQPRVSSCACPVLEALEHPGPLPAVLLVDGSTAPTRTSRRSCSRCWPTRRSPSRSSETAPTAPPAVILTSNRTRDLHDAIKRRCLYHWIDYPPFDEEVEIVRRRVPGTSDALARDVVGALSRLRAADDKRPGIAEGIDWVSALELLGAERLDAESADRTLGTVLKYREDQEAARAAGLETVVHRG